MWTYGLALLIKHGRGISWLVSFSRCSDCSNTVRFFAIAGVLTQTVAQASQRAGGPIILPITVAVIIAILV